MKKNLVRITLLIVLITISIWLYKSNSGSSLKRELSDFAVSDTAAVDKIFMADKFNKTILLERTPSGWIVGGKYEAKPEAVQLLLATMKDLTVKTPVSKAMHNTIIKNLAGSGIKVEIYQGGKKPVKTYYVGSANQEHTGSYMLMEGSSVPFLMHIEGFKGFLTPRYFMTEADWKNTRVFTYDIGQIKSIRVENFKKPNTSFEIKINDKNKYQLFTYPALKEVPFDTANLLLYIAQYQKVYFEFFCNQYDSLKIDSLKKMPGLYRYTVEDIFGKKNTIISYVMPGTAGDVDFEGRPMPINLDRMYAILNNEQYVIIQYYVFDPLSKPIEYFYPKAKLK